MANIRLDYILKLWFVFLSGALQAQTIQLSGTVLNKENKTPIPMVNIFTKDQKAGTASTVDGKFSIRVPVSQINTYLYFSCIGYETDSLLITRSNLSPTFYLMPKVYTLKELIVMPDSTLLTLLRKTYSKIPDNYPRQPTRYKGFYQESTFDLADSLIKLVEAELAVFKEGYDKKREAPGQIELLKSRIKQVQTLNGGHVGGAFMSIDEDVVLQREYFIHPQYFKHFHYKLAGIKSWKEKDCYEITFHSLNKDSVFQGTMLIDLQTLAYISFSLAYEKPENAKTLVGAIHPVKSTIKVEYEQLDGVYYLKQVSRRSKHENVRFKEPQFTSYDFITTQIQTDSVKPVPVEKRLEYMSPIEVIAEPYNPKGWTDSDIVAEENTGQPGFQFSSDEASGIFKQKVRIKKSFQSTLLEMIPKLVTGIGVRYSPSYKMVVLQEVLGYRFNTKWSVQGQYLEDLYNTRTSLKELSLGFEYRKNLNNAGYPLFLGTSLWVSNNFIQEKKQRQIREQAIVPQLSLSKRMGTFITMGVFVNYPIVFHSNTDYKKKYDPQVGLTLYFY